MLTEDVERLKNFLLFGQSNTYHGDLFPDMLELIKHYEEDTDKITRIQEEVGETNDSLSKRFGAMGTILKNGSMPQEYYALLTDLLSDSRKDMRKLVGAVHLI